MAGYAIDARGAMAYYPHVESMVAKEFAGYLSGRTYYAKRVGWHWEVWHAYQDGSSDDNGAHEWKASSVRYWRWINAARSANAMHAAFNDGVWCEGGRQS